MVDDLKFTVAQHRQQAVDLFNFTWTLIDKPDRTPVDDDLMIHSAHASRYHWSIAGNVVNYLRGDWQIAHVYTLLNLPERALHYAQCACANVKTIRLAIPIWPCLRSGGTRAGVPGESR